MTPTDATERVARGAALLDKTRPGWAERINLQRLHIDRCDSCVLGQLFEDEAKYSVLSGFWVGVALLDVEVWEHGFGIRAVRDPAISDRDTPATWKRLREAWTVAIQERLTPPAVWTHRDHRVSQKAAS